MKFNDCIELIKGVLIGNITQKEYKPSFFRNFRKSLSINL